MMKKRKTTGPLFCALALSAALTAGCGKTEYTDVEVTVYAPTLSLSVATLAASVDGGSYSFTYTVGNPTDDGVVSCASDASWISAVSDSGSGSISFEVAENATGSLRTGHVAVTYTYGGGLLTKTVTVAQNSSDIPAVFVEDPAITVETAGGDYSFEYTVLNPTVDGQLALDTDSDWISGLSRTSSAVSFSAAENTTGRLREGSVILTYTYGAGAVSETVTVYQDHPAGSGSALTSLYGNYTASGFVDGEDYSLEDATWQLQIYEYSGLEDYDLYIDGLLPNFAGYRDSLGTNAYSVCAYYRDDCIVVPSQCSDNRSTTVSGKKYYFGYTPCTSYDAASGTFKYSMYFPDLTFSYDSRTDTWMSDYGEFLALCATAGDITSIAIGYQVAAPSLSFSKVYGTDGQSEAD